MIRQTNVKQLQLTRELAEDFAALPTWAGERPLNPALLDTLRGKIEQGLFHSPDWAIAMLGVRCYRANGRHSSNALCRAANFPKGLQVSILEFGVDTEDDLVELFHQFDTHIPRQPIDFRQSDDDLEPGFSGVSNRTLKIIVSGISMAMAFDMDPYFPWSPSSFPADDKLRLQYSHGPFIAFAKEFAVSRMLGFAAVTAAMYMTWSHDPERAGRFWKQVLNRSHPDPANPTHLLATFLLSEVCGGSKWERRAVMVKCLHAWNAYWRGQSTLLRYVHEAPIPPLV